VALLGARLDVDQAGVPEHAKMLGYLRLLEVELLANLADRPRAGAQELDDAEAVWLGEGREQFEHGREYTLNGIYLSRYILRGRLDVIGMLDMPAWASVMGLLDECPVMPAALIATLDGRTGAVSATAFEFISTCSQLGRVREFMARFLDIVSR